METLIQASVSDILQEHTNLLNYRCSSQTLKGVQVLVVDNDKSSGEMYDVLLNHFDAIVTLARSVKEALEILDWLIPSIIVCEIRFLGESIYRLVEKLQAMETRSGNHIPIIVTSTCDATSREQIPGVEIEGYLLKPFNPEQLVLTISNLMQVRRNNLLAYI
jgi:CheY-like chemotaxis protein